ncbi:MAG TPA: PEGA domain-containing protein, partial [Myxococcota bacterium]|nr:PEGA domain-containing protein [Myxococcota bacterium]
MHQTAVRLAAAGLALGLALAVLAPRAHAASGAAAAPPAAPPGAPAVLPKVDAKAEAMAKKLEARADLALKDSRLDEAIDLYKEAYKLARRSADLLALGRLQYKKAESLFMPGATLEVLARAKLVYLEARASLEEWAKLEPTAPVHAEVLIILDDVAGKLKRVGDLLAPKASAGPAEVRVGRITVTANVEGASVLLDGVKVGKTPLVLEAVEVGDHTVAVAKLGTSPYTTSVVVVAEKTVELTVELEGLKPLAAPDLGGAGGGAGGV